MRCHAAASRPSCGWSSASCSLRASTWWVLGGNCACVWFHSKSITAALLSARAHLAASRPLTWCAGVEAVQGRAGQHAAEHAGNDDAEDDGSDDVRQGGTHGGHGGHGPQQQPFCGNGQRWRQQRPARLSLRQHAAAHTAANAELPSGVQVCGNMSTVGDLVSKARVHHADSWVPAPHGGISDRTVELTRLVMPMYAARASLLPATFQRRQRTTQQPQQRRSNLSQRQRLAPPSRSSQRRCLPSPHQRRSSRGGQPLSMWMTRATAAPWLQLAPAAEANRLLGVMRWELRLRSTDSECMRTWNTPGCPRHEQQPDRDQGYRVCKSCAGFVQFGCHACWLQAALPDSGAGAFPGGFPSGFPVPGGQSDQTGQGENSAVGQGGEGGGGGNKSTMAMLERMMVRIQHATARRFQSAHCSMRPADICPNAVR
jgi:hypothetical protein